MEPDSFPRPCGCGLMHDRASWEALPDRAFWEDDAVDAGLTLEQRRCPCGSHLSIIVSNPGGKPNVGSVSQA